MQMRKFDRPKHTRAPSTAHLRYWSARSRPTCSTCSLHARVSHSSHVHGARSNARSMQRTSSRYAWLAQTHETRQVLDKHLPHIIPAQHGARKRQEAGNTRVQAVSGELTFDRSTHAVANCILDAGPYVTPTAHGCCYLWHRVSCGVWATRRNAR